MVRFNLSLAIPFTTNICVGLYVSDLKKRSIENDFMAVIFGRPIPLDCVKVNETDENILEIDTLKAWKATDSHAGWSNEVAVEVIIR
jgi:hypothetical protein